MVNTQAVEFPFVEELPKLSDLPKRERTKLQRVWDHFQELGKITQEKGMLVPVRFAAKILDVSRQRCDELIRIGVLESVDLDGQRFVTEKSVIAFAKSERKAGRPVKCVADAETKGAVRAAFDLTKEILSKK